jgi:hypothetical protein
MAVYVDAELSLGSPSSYKRTFGLEEPFETSRDFSSRRFVRRESQSGQRQK